MSVNFPAVYLNKLKELFALKDHTHKATGIGFPDYANYEDIASAYNNARVNGYTISNDGWIRGTMVTANQLKINGAVVIIQSDAGATNSSAGIPVKKDDVLSGGTAKELLFFPMR